MREGARYRHWRGFLQESSQWNPQQIEEWQLGRLRETIRYAIDHTEGYRELYRSAGVKPNDLRCTSHVKYLPFISQTLLERNRESYTVEKLGAAAAGRTIERAFLHDAWQHFGWTPNTPVAVLRNEFVGTEARPWLWDPYRRELHLSSFYLSKDTLPVYSGALLRYGATHLQALPSALNVLCTLLQETGMAPCFPFESIFLTLDSDHGWQMRKTEAVFPVAKLFANHGCAEQAIFAAWCQHSRQYHINPFYGIVELVDGELIGTSFHNRAAPLLRYRTGTSADLGPQHCDRCGKHWRILPRLAAQRSCRFDADAA